MFLSSHCHILAVNPVDENGVLTINSDGTMTETESFTIGPENMNKDGSISETETIEVHDKSKPDAPPKTIHVTRPMPKDEQEAALGPQFNTASKKAQNTASKEAHTQAPKKAHKRAAGPEDGHKQPTPLKRPLLAPPTAAPTTSSAASLPQVDGSFGNTPRKAAHSSAQTAVKAAMAGVDSATYSSPVPMLVFILMLVLLAIVTCVVGVVLLYMKQQSPKRIYPQDGTTHRSEREGHGSEHGSCKEALQDQEEEPLNGIGTDSDDGFDEI